MPTDDRKTQHPFVRGGNKEAPAYPRTVGEGRKALKEPDPAKRSKAMRDLVGDPFMDK